MGINYGDFQLLKEVEVLVEEIANKVFDERIKDFKSKYSKEDKDTYDIRGNNGVAKYLGVSLPTIVRWKGDGVLDGSFIQNGHTIRYCGSLVRKALKENKVKVA